MIYPIEVDPSHHVFYTAADCAVWFYQMGMDFKERRRTGCKKKYHPKWILNLIAFYQGGFA